MGACINEFCFEAPGVAAEGLAALCLPAPLYAVVHKTEEPMVEEFYSFDVALRFFHESRRLGFVDRFAAKVPLTPAQRAQLGSAAHG